MTTAGAPGSPRIQMVRGAYFTYAMPEGWKLGEEGPYALSLASSEGNAGIIVTGISGLLYPLSPEQFMTSRLPALFQAMGAELLDLTIVSRQPLQPLPGYTAAMQFELAYSWRRPEETRQVRAVAFSHVAATYGRCDGVLTLASSKANLWEQRKGWLPSVAACAINTGPNPYGRAAVSANIYYNLQRENMAFQDYQNWSQQNWAGVQLARDAAFAHQTTNDTSLTGQGWFGNPYGYPAAQLAAGQNHWVHRDGRIYSTPDASFDPNTSTDPNWQRMTPTQG